jgi:hypothetical protein
MGQASKQDAVARAADKTRDLVRGMESLDQRMKEGSKDSKGSQGSQNAQGAQGSRSAQNSQGQQGQQGQGQQGQGQQGQGQQGQGQQGQGQQAQNGQAGDGGAYGGYWGGGYYNGGRWTGEDIRQFRGQYRQWTNDAEALRRQLQQAGVSPRDLEDALHDLRLFDTDRLYADPNGLAQLQAAAIEKLKKVEFALRRKAEAANDSLSLSGSDQVPESFRPAIEEYYRSLAKKGQTTTSQQPPTQQPQQR